MKIKTKDILPNPFRNIKHYPILREKVEQLKRSYEKTEFWDNIVGRINAKGEFEQAYGHHRKVALLEHYGPDHFVNVIDKKLPDSAMIQIMASENMEEWGSSAIVEIETVDAVVKAFAAGKIKLGKVSLQGDPVLRRAPSYLPIDKSDDASSLLYSAKTVSEFLGWRYKQGNRERTADKVHDALTALQYIEEDILQLSNFADLSTAGIGSVIATAKSARSRREYEARAAEKLAELARQDAEKAKKAAEQARALNDQAEARRQAAERDENIREAARQKAEAQRLRKQAHKDAGVAARASGNLLRDHKRLKDAASVAADEAVLPGKPKPPPDLKDALSKVLWEIYKFCGNDRLAEKLTEILRFKDALDEETLTDAAHTIRSVAERMEAWAKDFEPSTKLKRAKDGTLLLKR
jgi:ParB-like chromosome segregation protein Spo0J